MRAANRLKTVLVVDDDEAILRAWPRVLRGRHVVISARDAEEARAAIEVHRIDYAFVDLFLGSGASGIDVIRALRTAQPRACSVLLSARNSIEDTVNAMRAGAYDSRSKPVDVRGLLDELEARPRDVRVRTLASAQAQLIDEVLELCDGNKSMAATLLGVSRATVQRSQKPK